MKPRRFCYSMQIAIFICFLAAAGNRGQAQNPAAIAGSPLEGLDAYVEKALADWQIPGLSIAVVKNDSTALAKGYGVRDIRKSEPVDAHTLFAIASNSKAFTAAALGMLVQEGKISWDDPVLKYLPEFQLYDPEATRKITVRDLLCHRSGLATWGGDWAWWGSIYSRDEALRSIRYQKPVYDFRTGYGYSNQMFLVAGEVILSVTGQSWDDFIAERFFRPLGMNRSNTSVKTLEKMENVATPHLMVEGRLLPVAYLNVDNAGAAAGINSSVSDLAQWLRLQLAHGAFNEEQLLDSAVIEETRKPHTLRQISAANRKFNPFTHFSLYGLGWDLSDYRGRLIVSHTGGLDGMFSYTGFMPEENLGVAVLTNREDHSLMQALALHVYDAYLGADLQDWSARYLERNRGREQREREARERQLAARVANTQSSHSLQHYAGSYHNDIYGAAKIELANNKMTLYPLAHPGITGTLEHWQYDTFRCKWSSAVWQESFIYFELNDAGEVARFRVKVRPDWVDTLEYTFEKIRGE